MDVLVGCEESQKVCIAFRSKNHDAYSCDLKMCSGGFPQYHLKMDIFDAIKIKKWDLIILHPDCTYMAVSGNRWYSKSKERISSVQWTIKLFESAKESCCKICLENPVSVIFRQLNGGVLQYINPWQFGHGECKKTGLYLYGLPFLKHTNIVQGREQKIWKMPPSKNRKEIRSKTYTGIANAMAEQWG
jgi:hypothetical protein